MKNKPFLALLLSLALPMLLAVAGCNTAQQPDSDDAPSFPYVTPDTTTVRPETEPPVSEGNTDPIPDSSPVQDSTQPPESQTQPASETTDAPVESSDPSLPASLPEDDPAVHFIGGGDNIIYYGNVYEASVRKLPGGRTYNFKTVYSDIQGLIEDADLAFINQETLLCSSKFPLSYYPQFCGPQDMGYDLVEMGFDVVNIASNHMLDVGADGLADSITFWKKQPVTMIGGYEDEADFAKIRITEVKGIRIAWLAFTYGTNMLTLPEDSPLYIPYINDEDIAAQIASAREQADLVFVSMHWGAESVFDPTPEQSKAAQLIADCGADVIIGHHPHVVGPIRWILGEGGNKTLCVYSLGNLMAEMSQDYNMAGGLITFDIVPHEGAKPTIENVLFIPTFFHFDPAFKVNHIYLYKDYTDELARSHGISYYGNSTTLDKLKRYVKNTIHEQFLPDDF